MAKFNVLMLFIVLGIPTTGAGADDFRDMLKEIKKDLHEYGGTYLHKLASMGSSERIERQLGGRDVARLTDIEERDKADRTALHWAAISGHGAAVKVLLEYGANTEARDKDGKTPRDVAKYDGIRRLIDQATRYGAAPCASE